MRKSKKNRHYHGYSAGNRFYGCDSIKNLRQMKFGYFVHNLPQNVKLFNAQENCVVMNDCHGLSG